VKTRYTSIETTNRNSSSTKSSRRSSNIPKIVKQNDRSSANNSLIRDITTPDKFIPLHQKSSSSTKKSTIKSFRPGSSGVRHAQQYGLHDSSSKKSVYPEIYSRKDSQSKYKMSCKLDFNAKSIGGINMMSGKSKLAKNTTVQKQLTNKIPRAPQTKRNSQMYGTFCKAEYETKKRLSSRNTQNSYKGIYNTLDNTKPTSSNDGGQTPLNIMGENISSAFNKVGMNWAIKNKPADNFKESKNYRSMTSLMNNPTVAKKFHIKKNKHIVQHGQNVQPTFMSGRYTTDGSATRNQTSASGRSNVQPRCRATSQTSQNSSITRRYQLKNIHCNSFALLNNAKVN
jgi:hypothetical protein